MIHGFSECVPSTLYHVYCTIKRLFLFISFLAFYQCLYAQQVVIYQQNFDGNNGTFTNTIVSQGTAINGWLASSTAAQYNNYRHLWNFGSTGTGNVAPITNRSLGMGFYLLNDPNVVGQPFRTWDGTNCSVLGVTTRWAHVGISTVGYQNIQVEFKWRCIGEVDAGVAYDYGTVNTSIDGGSSWLMDQTSGAGGSTGAHGTFTGGLYHSNAGVQTATINLPATRNDKPNFRLAFRMVVDECYGTGGGFIIDDIIVRGTPISSCVAGTASGPSFVFTGSTASLALIGYVGNIQWQVSSDGTTGWANVVGGVGATISSYASGNLTTGNYYYRAMVTDGSCTTYSNTVHVVVASQPVYCSGAGIGNAFSGNHLESIAFHEWVDPNPGNYSNNYMNYSDTLVHGYATVVAGQYHHLNALIRANGTGTAATTFAYWIDWNRDGVFNNTAFTSGGEKIDQILYTSTLGNTYASYFTVPATASGMVRVRFRVVRGDQGAIDPCIVYSNSQTKDFMIKVIPGIGPQVCNGVNGTADVVRANSGQKVNITRVNIEGPNGTVLNNDSQFFGVQAGATITMYNYSNFMGSYSNGLAMEEGSSYTISIEHSGFTNAAGLFIDYNGDGDFDDTDELVGRISDPNINPFVFNFTIPTVALDGKQVAMRVRMRYDAGGNLGSTIHACNNIADTYREYSEVEDYRLTLRKMITPLPIELASFTGSCEDGNVKLTWVTASEINNEKFVIERSPDLLEWTEVLTHRGSGNSNQPIIYSGLDLRPLEGIGYYRLTQKDYDGASETFTPISILCYTDGSGNNMMVYPNPTDDQFTVKLHLLDACHDCSIEITDMNGKRLILQNVNIDKGENSYTFDRAGMNSGQYIIQLKSGDFMVKPVKLVVK